MPPWLIGRTASLLFCIRNGARHYTYTVTFDATGGDYTYWDASVGRLTYLAHAAHPGGGDSVMFRWKDAPMRSARDRGSATLWLEAAGVTGASAYGTWSSDDQRDAGEEWTR